MKKPWLIVADHKLIVKLTSLKAPLKYATNANRIRNRTENENILFCFKSVHFKVMQVSVKSFLCFNGNLSNYSPVLFCFLKIKTKGIVAREIAAEKTKTNPSNPADTPKEKAVAAKTGEIVCARPAIAQATPKLPP